MRSVLPHCDLLMNCGQEILHLDYDATKGGTDLGSQCTKVPLALVRRLNWDVLCKTIDDDCAYACASHLVKFIKLTVIQLHG